MKIYLAARWSRREEMVEVRRQLENLGATITARWLTDPEHRGGDAKSQAFNAMLANHDREDLGAADMVVYFGPGGSRGGCHVEFGMALALGKRVVHVGPLENVFTWLPEVEHHETPEAFLEKVSW